MTAVDVSRETFNELNTLRDKYQEQLNNYLDALIDCNQRINLISRKLSRDDIINHISHSLLPSVLINFENDRIWDSGTGGGLPGIPLAITLPDYNFILHDKSTKKLNTLDQIIRQLDLTNCTTRGDDLNNIRESNRVSLISKHTYKVNDIIVRSKKINWSDCYLLKGADYQDEISKYNLHNFTFREYRLDNGGEFFAGKVILEIRKKSS